MMFALLASGCGRKSAPADPIHADEPSTKTNVDAAKKKATADWERLGSFSLLRYSELTAIDGERFRILKYGPDPDVGPLKGVAFLDAAGKVVLERKALPDMFAMSWDGRLQFVASAAGTQRVDANTMAKQPWTGSGYPEWISDDGTLLVTTDLDVYDLATEKRICHVDPPFAGGAEGVYRFEAGSRFLTMGNGRGSYLYDPRACKGDPVAIGQRFRISADGNVVVVIPHEQFAVGWSDAFVVVDGKTGAELRKLPLTIPEPPPDPDGGAIDPPRFDAALSPHGDLLIVAYARELVVLRVADGREVHRESVADLVAKNAEVTIVASRTQLALASAGKLTRFALPAP
jgi:hypothetical protein